MLLCMTILAVIITVIHITVYLTVKNDIEEQFEMSAKGLVVSIADTLMINIEEYKLFIETRNVDSDYYKKMQAYFAKIKANSNIKYIYSERKLDDKTIEFILDSEPIGNPDYSPPGSTGPNDPEREATYSTGKPSSFKFVEYSKWGRLLGAYAPIFDADGEMLGIVGVNIDASYLYLHINRLNLALLACYVFILGLSFLSLSKYSNMILEPLLKDKLTGAYTKRYFENFLRSEIDHAIKNRKDLALMILDLDHFKTVNDTYGHIFGDEVLSFISGIVKKSLRPSDCFVRYGGEEFVVIISDANIAQVMQVAERIRNAVENSEIYNEEENIQVRTTVSIGVSNLNNRVIDAKELIDSTDKALYAAKTERNKVSYHAPPGRNL